MTKVATLLLLGCFAACSPFAADSGKSHGEDTTEPAPPKTKGTNTDAPPGADADDDTTDSDADPVVDTTLLDPFFLAQMKTNNIPGMSVAVVRDGHLKWTKGYGLADIASKAPVTRDTLFMLAGLASPITAAALMQLIEDPKNGMTLDSDVSEKLGFSVRSPHFASTPITYRMLLSHTSSLVDGSAPSYVQGDSTTPLATFVRNAVADKNGWLTEKPGTANEYSVVGIALIGLVVEMVTGQNLQAYAQSHIFAPLGMSESSYFLKGLDPAHVAQPYDGADLKPQGNYGYPEYPTGQLRTSAPQLASFLMMFTKGGMFRNARVLSSATIDEMDTAQVPSVEPMQLLSLYRQKIAGKSVIGMSGWDKGVTTEMYFDPTTKAGYVLLTNAAESVSEPAMVSAIGDRLLELALTLP